MARKDLVDTDSEDEDKIKKDEYGDEFEDYGFLARAYDHKERGNEEFKKERYERAMKEYDGALDQLMTVAYDKSIILGKRKWADVVIFRSTLHLNKSACHFKLRNWQKSVEEAKECIIGNVRDEMMFTDAAIRMKVKEADRKNGACGVEFLEQKLPRGLRAKAWMRLSKCYLNLEESERAREACAQALETAEDEQVLAELSKHSVRIDALEKQQRLRQKKQFSGFWNKLQEQGGYVDSRAQKNAQFANLSYEEKVRRLEELDDSDGEDEGPSAYLAAKASKAEAVFEDRAALPKGDAPDRPAAQEEAQLAPVTQPGSYKAADIMEQRQAESQQRERLWRDNYWQTKADEEEDEELRKARERLAQKKLLQQGAAAKTKLQALEDSSDDERKAK